MVQRVRTPLALRHVILLPDVCLKPALTFSLSPSDFRTHLKKERGKKMGKGIRAKKRFHNEKIPNVNMRLFSLFLFAARQTPQAITQVLIQQSNKELECSLEEEKLNPTGPSTTKEKKKNFTYYFFVQITKSRNYTYLCFLIRQ